MTIPWQELLGGMSSLDIETTGLNPAQNRTWNLGVATPNSAHDLEEFYAFKQGNVNISSQNNAATRGGKLHAAHGGDASAFARSQQAGGAYKGFEDASVLMDPLATIPAAIQHAIDKADNKGILIQNLNFEDKHLNEGMHQSPGDKIRDQFYVGGEAGNTKKLFQRPKALEDATYDFSRSYYTQYGKSHGDPTVAAAFQDKTDALETQLRDYIGKAKGANKAYAVDLMDISRLFYAKAALQGYIDPTKAFSLSSVDFLTRAFEGRAEKHMALADAKDQTMILNHFTNALEQLDQHGTISDDMKRVFAYAEEGFGEVNRNFLKTLHSGLGDIDPLSEHGTIKKKLEEIQTKRSYMPEDQKGFNRGSFVKKLDGMAADGKSVTDIQDFIQSQMLKVNGSGDEYKEVLKDFGKPGISKKVIGAGVVGAVILGMMATTDNKQKEKKLGTYDELYNNMSLGQGLADWEGRTNSYQMGY